MTQSPPDRKGVALIIEIMGLRLNLELMIGGPV